ncbi:MAG: thiamine pyrophosphate-dependent enzyme, partial [Gemmatimonadota bacterium]|nr:thiamine pyrophosphate-dependent enzyme [Gemmatimonadota bacterium]
MATLEHEIDAGTESDLPDRETHRAWYRTMVTARHIDDREAKLYKQGKVFFLIAGAGHEAVQVALADFLRPGSDWFYLYYRDRALALALGVNPMEQLLQGMGAEA